MRRICALASLALALTVGLVAMPAASATAIPFTDPNAHGSIGFCDSAAHEVTSGDIGAAPFTAYAVSSAPAPAGYGTDKQGRAALYAYQPIQYLDPGNWSGKQMSAASIFTNSRYPKSAQTVVDPALVDFTSAFPPHWDGLVQFRMFFSAPYRAPYASTYPTAVVKVAGNRWSLIQGGGVPCNSGKSTSVEVRSLPKSVFNNATPRATPGAAGATGSTSHHGTTGTSKDASSAAGAASGGASSATADASPVAAAKKSGTSTGAVWAILLAAVAAATIGFVVWRRRRTS
jgi:hypothetical protein